MSQKDQLDWAIVGVGIAGRARAKAIASDPRATLVSVWRGRFARDVGAPLAPDLDAAIRTADAVAICSPTTAHADQVRRVLEADRHCLVEFPVAPDPSTAADLFALARSRELLLHVEHIELLDAPCQTLRAHVRPEVVQQVHVSFERAGPEDASAADLALGNVARLHRVTAITGPLRSVDRVEIEGGRLTASLTTAAGASVTCRFQQGPYFSRRTVLEVTTPGAVWEQVNDTLKRDGSPQTLLGAGSRFARDQRAASARVLDGAPPYVSEARILHVLDVVERLGRTELGVLPQR